VASVTQSRAERRLPGRRRALTIRWRLVVLVGSAIALLCIAAVTTSYLAVRTSLMNDLQGRLREDAGRVAALYGSGEPGTASENLSGPTGGVLISLYDSAGRFLASSSGLFEHPETLLPQEVVAAAATGTIDWQGSLDGRTVLASIAPFGVGIAAVISDTSYIDSALTRLARILLGITVVLIAASGLVGYIVAGSALAPLRNLSRQAASLGPDRLESITYSGPQDELGLLSGVLNHLIARLKDTMDGQRQFLLETSHELRTPLTSLQGFLDRAIRRAGPEVRSELGDARRIASNMARLVEDLLHLSRGQSVRELVPHLVDPYEDVLCHIADEYPGVRVKGEPGVLLIGDPGRLRQLVRNLTANAVRAAGEENVELELRPTPDTAELIVRDTGPGIPAEVQERIFDKFYKGAGGGAGLGLAIARQISEQHEGSIRLQSRPGLTEFIATLPLLDSQENEA
jgi:two-component system OmpR family sensor kinase